MSTLLEVDGRKRVSLGAAATAERYLLEQDEGGVITLTPAVVMTADEVKLLSRPDITEAVERSRAKALAGSPGAARPTRRRRSAA